MDYAAEYHSVSVVHEFGHICHSVGALRQWPNAKPTQCCTSETRYYLPGADFRFFVPPVLLRNKASYGARGLFPRAAICHPEWVYGSRPMLPNGQRRVWVTVAKDSSLVGRRIRPVPADPLRMTNGPLSAACFLSLERITSIFRGRVQRTDQDHSGSPNACGQCVARSTVY